MNGTDLTQLQKQIGEEIAGIVNHKLGHFIPLITPVDRSIYTKTDAERAILRQIKNALK